MSDNPKDFYGIDDEIRELGYKIAKLGVLGTPSEFGILKRRLDWAIKCKEKHHGEANKESIQQSTSGDPPMG